MSRCHLRSPSVDLSLRELLLDGLFAGFAVREVEAEVSPVVGGAAVGDGDGVAHSEVHGLHHPLPLQLPGAADGDGGGVAAGADQLLGPVVVALLEVLQTPPDDHPVLLRDLQCSEILQGQHGEMGLCPGPPGDAFGGTQGHDAQWSGAGPPTMAVGASSSGLFLICNPVTQLQLCRLHNFFVVFRGIHMELM